MFGVRGARVSNANVVQISASAPPGYRDPAPRARRSEFSPLRVVQYVSFTSHFSADYIRGVVDLRYMFFYVSVAILLLFFTVRVVEARKWR